MEELEGWAERWLTKPIQGERRVLRFWRQVLAASWAVKTALVWESIEPDHRTIHPAVLRAFYFIQRPSIRQTVWIGRYNGNEPHPVRRTAAFLIGSRPEGADDPPHADAYLVAFAVGQLAFAVFGHLLTADGPEGVPEFSFPPQFATKLVQIWPMEHEVVIWPPTDSLDDAALDACVRSLGQPMQSKQ